MSLHGCKEDTIARLKRNLYGSKSAPKSWYKCLHEVLIELGFKSVADEVDPIFAERV
jgi:hypothetical protein